MAVASFEELCAGFCEIAGLHAPALRPDARGLLAFHTNIRGVVVDFLHWPELRADAAFVLFNFGAIPQQAESRLLRALLKANFLPFQRWHPNYACNPASGDLMLQYSAALSAITAHDLLELVEDGVSNALHWRERSDRQIVATPILEKA